MAFFTIKLNYKASVVFEVEADDEGKALDKARNLAEDADIDQFSVGEELDSEIIGRC